MATLEARAQQFHRESFVADSAATILSPAHIDGDLPELRAAGMNLAFITVSSAATDFRATVNFIAAWYEAIAARSGQLALVTSLRDIDEQVVAQDKLGLVLAFQDTRAIDGDLKLVEVFWRMGVRCIGLTYNERNLAGDGSTEPSNCGLSEYGEELVHEIHRAGILLDLSHVGDASSMDAIRLSDRPPVYTHSNCRSVVNHPRNILDDHIRAATAKGGVIGLNVMREANGDTLDDVLNHVDHIVKVSGVDHVGFGLDVHTRATMADFKAWKMKESVYSKPPWQYPKGIERLSDWPNITKGLLERGYPEDAVRKMIGGNFLRVIREVWRS